MSLKECPLRLLCKYHQEGDYACKKQYKSCIHISKIKSYNIEEL